jgi:hypothetical protein
MEEKKWDDDEILEDGFEEPSFECGGDEPPSALERYLERCETFGEEPDDDYVYELSMLEEMYN